MQQPEYVTSKVHSSSSSSSSEEELAVTAQKIMITESFQGHLEYLVNLETKLEEMKTTLVDCFRSLKLHIAEHASDLENLKQLTVPNKTVNCERMEDGDGAGAGAGEDKVSVEHEDDLNSSFLIVDAESNSSDDVDDVVDGYVEDQRVHSLHVPDNSDDLVLADMSNLRWTACAYSSESCDEGI